MSKILIINTGGTIGMVNTDPDNKTSPLRPAENWNEIIQDYRALKRYNTEYINLDPLIDSSDFNFKYWDRLVDIIKNNYNNYDGFIILHGTDTMAHTASMLSFVLKNLSKPIILTGSQVPISNGRNDGLQNLITSLEIVDYKNNNLPLIPEVMIFFRDILIRGNRARKLDASNYFGFSSPNYEILARVGVNINVFEDRCLKIPDKKEKFYTDFQLSNEVIVLDVFPEFNLSIFDMILNNDNIKGIILKTYGSGNVTSNSEFIDRLKKLINKKIVVVNISQCPTGTVRQGLYETSMQLLNIGVVSGLDMTPEAAILKLMYLLGHKKSYDDILKEMQINMIGEQSNNIITYDLKKDSIDIDLSDIIYKKIKKLILFLNYKDIKSKKEIEIVTNHNNKLLKKEISNKMIMLDLQEEANLNYKNLKFVKINVFDELKIGKLIFYLKI